TAQNPIWSSDGRRILYASTKDGKFAIYAIAADGSGSPELILTAGAPATPLSMAPDGRTLLYEQMSMDENSSIMLRTGGAEPRRFHENATRAHAAAREAE